MTHYKQNEVNWKSVSFKARAKYFSTLGANAEVHFDKSLKPIIFLTYQIESQCDGNSYLLF